MKQVNLVAPLNQLGYGVVGYNVLRALSKKADVSYWPIGQATWESAVPFAEAATKKSKTYNHRAPSLRIWHQNDFAMMPGSGPRFGWPIFELDTFTDEELLHLNSLDCVIVCSEWAKDVVKRHLPKKRVEVCPLGVNTSLFHPDGEAKKNKVYWTSKKTVFLNAGKWEVRKGHNELLEAFCTAFKPGDDVELWMLNENNFIGLKNEEWKAKYLSSPMGEHVRIVPRIETRADMRELFNIATFGVFPAHAEGWNLEILELMACGKPSIVTNCTGHTQFCNESNSLLVETTGLEPAQDGIWFHGQGNWHSFNAYDVAEQMKRAHEMNTEDYNKLSEECILTAHKLSWENVADRLLEIMYE